MDTDQKPAGEFVPRLLKNPGLSSRWIYSRPKAELLAFAEEFGFSPDGVVDDLRRSFVTLIKESEQPQEVEKSGRDPVVSPPAKMPILDAHVAPPGSTTPVPLTSFVVTTPSFTVTAPSLAVAAPPTFTTARETYAEPSYDRPRRDFVCVPERIRKWGLQFDGYSDPLAFIEQVESRALSYGIDLGLLPRAMAELLTSRADKWFQTSRLQEADWATFRREFLEFFLPPRYLQRLDDRIRSREQLGEETFKDYMLDLRVLMRHAGYNETQELDRLYENIAPDYQMYIRRSEFQTIGELAQLATEFEAWGSNIFPRVHQIKRRSADARSGTAARARASKPGSDTRSPHQRAGCVPKLRGFRAFQPRMPEPSAILLLGLRTTRCSHLRVLPPTPAGKRSGSPRPAESVGDQSRNEHLVNAPLRIERGRIAAEVEIGGHRRLATIDTGASKSFISQEVANLVGQRHQFQEIRTQINLADTSRVEVRQLLRADITLARKTIQVPLFVMPAMLEPLILGMDFLATIGTTIQCGTAKLILSRRQPEERDMRPPRDARRSIHTTDSRTTEPPSPRGPAGSELSKEAPPTRPEDPRLGIADHFTETHAGEQHKIHENTNAGEQYNEHTETHGSPDAGTQGRHTETHRSPDAGIQGRHAETHESPSAGTQGRHAETHESPSAGKQGKYTEAHRNPSTGTSESNLMNLHEMVNTEDKHTEAHIDTHPETPEENLEGAPEATNEEQDPRIQEFLYEQLVQFEGMTGVANIAEHRITMRDDRPIKQRYFPKNPAMQKIIDEQVDALLDQHCIEPSRSPHSAPLVLVRKKTGQWRMCVDYRQLNAKSIPDAYPLPRINHILERLRNAKYISTLDLRNGYWQIPMEAGSRACTAFTVPGRGLFQWRVMPFGLHSAPATFQRALDSVIGPDLDPYAFAYLDDIIVIGASLEEHMENLRRVFKRLRKANLRINQDKCSFFKRKLVYLGHVISDQGIHTDPEKVAAVRNLSPPTSLRELRRCLGMASWYRRFVPNFASVVQPMTNLLRKNQRWKWEQEQQKAFELLKSLLTDAPVLACPDFSVKMTLQTDASNYGLGGVLTQEIEGQERVIAYVSRKLDAAELNYSPTEKECLAIVWGIRKLRCYLEGYRFDVITDHLALKWLDQIENPTGRIARWALDLQQYQYDVHYRLGKYNVVADALSRQPLEHLQRLMPDERLCKWLKRKLADVQDDPQRFPDYVIQNGELYRHLGHRPDDQDYIPWKLCVAAEHRARILQECHDALTAGHFGTRKTILRISQKYYWPGMFRDVKQYVRQCALCQKYKAEQKAQAGRMLTRQVDEPFGIVCADFVGPLPRSKAGNTMLLVFFDSFTKWVELVPLRKATTTTLIQAFRERIIGRFGAPKKLVCDNGTQFTSKAFRGFLREMGVELQYTAPYCPRENPTERANRTVKTMISQYVGSDQSTWDQLIPELSLAINTSISETTGYSPAFLLQAREPRLPGSWYDQVTPGAGVAPETPADRAGRLKEIFQIVQTNIQKASRDQGRQYDLRRRAWRPTIGSLVLVRQHHLSKAVDGFAAKLAPKFDGPYKVVALPSPNIARIRLPGKRKGRLANIADLKEFHSFLPTSDADTDDDAMSEDNAGVQPGSDKPRSPDRDISEG
nr:uncharacterized protein LOC121502491 [Drosophila kikkawai]